MNKKCQKYYLKLFPLKAFQNAEQRSEICELDIEKLP